MPNTLVLKQVVAAVIVRENQVLICQRREDQPFALQWEFPGGKVEHGEELVSALVRELREELAISAVIGREIAMVRHQYAEGLGVELHFFLVTQFSGEIQNEIFHEIRWEERGALNPLNFLEADQGVVEKIKDGLLA